MKPFRFNYFSSSSLSYFNLQMKANSFTQSTTLMANYLMTNFISCYLKNNNCYMTVCFYHCDYKIANSSMLGTIPMLPNGTPEAGDGSGGSVPCPPSGPVKTTTSPAL